MSLQLLARFASSRGPRLLLLIAACSWAPVCVAEEPDPIFDLAAIQNDPLEAKVLKTSEEAGIVVEEVEYNGPRLDGKPVRVFGILAYPKGAKQIPAIFWSQNGMAPAGDYFPKLFAKKGYFCLNVTLDHAVWKSFEPFDTASPRTANLTRLADVQMRGITYMTQRSEVDRERIGMSGGSYGSFFATLIAGADPRVKAGMGFFGSGNHQLGTNLPQFNALSTKAEMEIWTKTIDPGWRLRKRAVPFLWGVGSNDHWFELPAIFKTYEESVGDKCLAVAIPWGHAGPENMDEQLINWFDIYLLKTRPPLNVPGALTVAARDGKLMANWTWTGDKPVAKAEIVVSYGPARPWHQWIHRSHMPFPATVGDHQASGEIPVLEPGLGLFTYGLLTDADGAMCVTLPQTIQPSAVGAIRTTLAAPVNLFPQGDFEADAFTFWTRSGEPTGTADTEVKHSGKQSMRLAPGQSIPIKLFHVPTRSHKLTLWARAEKADTLTVAVHALPPANQQSRLVQILRSETATPVLPAGDGKAVERRFALAAAVGPDWKQITIACPYADEPIAGYQLVLTAGNEGSCWVDTARFEPVWK